MTVGILNKIVSAAGITVYCKKTLRMTEKYDVIMSLITKLRCDNARGRQLQRDNAYDNWAKKQAHEQLQAW